MRRDVLLLLRAPLLIVSVGTLGASIVVAGACAASKDLGPGGAVDTGDDGAADSDPGFDFGDADGPDGALLPDPTTCDEARINRSYLGCEFWPTVLANSVWETFDFTAVVANPGDVDTTASVQGPNGYLKATPVPAHKLVKLYLPWVKELKGREADSCGSGSGFDGTVRVDKGAYRLVTTAPVAVYQFNALEYKGQGGPTGKSWAGCPGNTNCILPSGFNIGPIGCFSFTNDASLLLPTTALTGNYRITGQHGGPGVNPYFAVTGTAPGTDVTVTLGKSGRILAGGGLNFVPGGGTATFTLGAGDVIEIVGPALLGSDHSGSLVHASKPVQVLAGVPCMEVPAGAPACDHLESTVLPAETMGKAYVVVMPTGPTANTPGHVVRMYGNVDGTNLTYLPSAPKNAPATLKAGQVVDLGVVKDNFMVTGDQPFAVNSLMLGASLVDAAASPGMQKGDPSMSTLAAVEQFRLSYTFLAPDDYLVSYADVVAPIGAKLLLDGKDALPIRQSVPGTSFEVRRIKIPAGTLGGAHVVTSDKPIGLQVLGYGLYTSYQFPGGLNLQQIAPPPK